MIEQAMFYALGFSSAGLLALAVLPAVWKRAVRLTDRRLRQLAPLSAEEITAERDQLRAGFAVEQRRVEQKLERSETTRAALLADIGRGEARQLALETELRHATDRAQDLAQTLQAAERAIHGLHSETGTAAIALNDLTGLAEQRFWEVEAAQSRIRELESGVDEGRATAAALQTRILGLETRLGDVHQALGVTKAELARTVDAVTRAQAERDVARRTAANGDGEMAGAAGTARRLEAERDALRLELASSRDAHAAALGQIKDLRAELTGAMRKAADGAGPTIATAADIGLVRDQLRLISDEILRAARSGPEPRAAATGPEAAHAERGDG